jgi:hypothetical protein
MRIGYFIGGTLAGLVIDVIALVDPIKTSDSYPHRLRIGGLQRRRRCGASTENELDNQTLGALKSTGLVVGPIGQRREGSRVW